MPNGTSRSTQKTMRDATLPSSTASVRLRGQPVRLDVADVVDHEDRARDESRDHPAVPGLLIDGSGQHVRGARGRDQPEEDEDEDLTQTVVAVGTLAAGVEPGRRDRRGADEEHPPVLRQDHEDESGYRRQREEGQGDRENRARRGLARPGEAARARRGTRPCRGRRRSSRWRSSRRSGAAPPPRGTAASGWGARWRGLRPPWRHRHRSAPVRPRAAGCAGGRRRSSPPWWRAWPPRSQRRAGRCALHEDRAPSAGPSAASVACSHSSQSES